LDESCDTCKEEEEMKKSGVILLDVRFATAPTAVTAMKSYYPSNFVYITM
jgi:hypothetical protein